MSQAPCPDSLAVRALVEVAMRLQVIKDSCTDLKTADNDYSIEGHCTYVEAQVESAERWIDALIAELRATK